MPVPKVKSESEPISEVTKVTTITNPVGQKNVVGTQINPATEDTLTKLMPTTVTKYAVAITSADTEYSQALVGGGGYIQKLTVQCRTAADMKLSYTSGESGTKYITIKSGTVYTEGDLIGDITLYLQSHTAGVVAEIVVAEIVVWS